MILRALGLISFAAFGLCTAQELTLPVTVCHRSSADHSTCLKDAIQEAWPRIIKGLPEFNFPSLEPLFYENHHAKYDNGDVHADIEASRIITTGLANSTFVFVKTHFADNVFRLENDLNIPMTINKGTVKIIGSLGPFTLNSTGNFSITSTDLKIRWILKGPVKNDRWIVEHFRVIPTITGMKVYINGLLNSEELESVMNDFLNEYWPALYRAMGSVIIDTWEPYLASLVNRIFSKVSFSKLFPN